MLASRSHWPLEVFIPLMVQRARHVGQVNSRRLQMQRRAPPALKEVNPLSVQLKQPRVQAKSH